jgi:hypothetical protein
MVNNSNHWAEYNFNLQTSTDFSTGEGVTLDMDQSVSLEPSSGRIAPFSIQKVEILFRPELTGRDLRFFQKVLQLTGSELEAFELKNEYACKEKVYNCRLRSVVDNVREDNEFSLRAVIPAINVSPTQARFQDCQLGKSKQLLLEVTNLETKYKLRL